jgi:signal transduction histidine kinase/HAMP domain-containing protein
MPRRIRDRADAGRPRFRIGVRLWLGAAFAMVGIVTAGSLFLFVTDRSEDVISQSAEELAIGQTLRIADRLGDAPPTAAARILANDRNDNDNTFDGWAFNQNGNLISSPFTERTNVNSIGVGQEAVDRALRGGRFLSPQPDDVTVVAVPIFRDEAIDGALLGRSLRPPALGRSLDQLTADTLTALAFSIGLAIWVGFVVASLISIRLRRLAGAAQRMAEGELESPLETAGADEIGDLARSLDSMQAALRDSLAVLSSERDKLSEIFAGLAEAVMVVSNDGTVRFSNPASEPLISPGGEPIEPLLPWLRRAAKRGTSEQGAFRVADRVYALQARDIPAEQAVLLVVRDRTEEMRRELAEREFVSNAALELRNPIAGISGAIEVLQGGAKDDPEARDHFLHRLSEDADRISRLTQSLLTLARVEAIGEGKGELGQVDVSQVAEDATRGVGPPEGIELIIEVEPDLVAEGDPVLMRQVLTGLLTNAYKITPTPGTVTLSGRRQNGQVLIAVSDTGPGIPAEERDRVFERFYRGAGARHQEGFGLGLSIAKRMVDVMGGELGVDSELGAGSTFWVRLPAGDHRPEDIRAAATTAVGRG